MCGVGHYHENCIHQITDYVKAKYYFDNSVILKAQYVGFPG